MPTAPGLVGHKPTWGAVPLDGCVPLAPSLDCGGALVRTVPDARLALAVLSGRHLPPGSTKGLRAGVLAGTPHRARVTDDAGLYLVEVALPLADRLAEVYGLVCGAEALSWHRGTGRWPARADDYGTDVRGHLERAEAADPQRVERAQALRIWLRDEVSALFERVDVLLLPVATAGPPPVHVGAGAVRDAVLPGTVAANLCGLPACSVPIGVDADGLPVGLQVVGPPGHDARVLDVAEALQAPLPWG